MAQSTETSLAYLETSIHLPGLRLPVRTTIARLHGGCVVLSPASRLTDEQLRAIGPVTDLVAPNLLHTAGMPRAAAIYPGARLWGPPGAAHKHPGLRWSVLGETPWPHDDLQPLALDGLPAVREFAFVHRPLRTLLVADLVFNLTEASGIGARLLLGLFGTWRRFAVSRLFLREAKDRAALARSLERLMQADFDRVVPGHGAVVEDGGRELLRAALRERGLAA
jgi:hypothetical protein